MRWITPRPLLLALTLMLVIGAIAAIELRLDARAQTGAVHRRVRTSSRKAAHKSDQAVLSDKTAVARHRPATIRLLRT